MPTKRTSKQDTKSTKKMDKIKCNVKGGGCGGAFYFLGFIGALVYYLSTAPTFTAAVVGFLKAIVWPAFLVHGLLAYLGL